MKPMLASEMSEDQLDFFLNDEMWVAEPKLDGRRVQIDIRSFLVSFLNRKEEAIQLPVSIVKALDPLPELTLDGEYLTGARQYWAFDILRYGDHDVAHLSLDSRRRRLEKVFRHVAASSPVRLVPQAMWQDAKRDLLSRIEDGNGEGLIFKHRLSRYRSERSTDWQKYKRVHEADVIVTGLRPNDKDAVTISFVDEDGSLVPAGRVAMIKSRLPRCEIGTVLTVRYLYVLDGSTKLVQPRFVEFRGDKAPSECTVDQIRYAATNKEIFSDTE